MREARRALAHVAPHHHGARARVGAAVLLRLLQQEARAAEADLPRVLLVKGLGIDAADVVGLEDLAEHGVVPVGGSRES